MDLSTRCENRSWATVGATATTDRYGNDVALVVGRVAYAVSPGGRVTLDYRPVRWTETPDGHGGVKFPSDLVDEKPGTDVGLVGTAHPPKDAGDSYMAWLNVGIARKVIRITGPRVFTSSWGRIVPGEAAPVGPTPLRYDLCYGGTEEPKEAGDHPTPEPHNPVGRGFATDDTLHVGKPAPQLEPVIDPALPLAAHRCHGCFAPIRQSWEPRRRRIGTRDAGWMRHRAPTPPVDFDPTFHCWAVPELHTDRPLVGDEPVEVAGVLPEGVWRFALPKYQLTFGTKSLDGWDVVPSHLDSVLIDADARVVELTWRASIPLPTPWEKLVPVRVWSETPMPKEILPPSSPATSTASRAEV